MKRGKKMIIFSSPILSDLLDRGYQIHALEEKCSTFGVEEVVNQGSGKNRKKSEKG